MRLEVSKCYELTNNGRVIRFRVVRYDSRGLLTIRICETQEEEDLYQDTLRGGLYEDFSIVEFNCEECDGRS